MNSFANLLFKSMERNSARTAIIYGNQEFSYKKIIDNTGKIKALLEEKYNISAGDIVAIKVEKNPDCISLILAIIALNACYLPLSKDDNSIRSEKMLKAVGPKVLVSFGEFPCNQYSFLSSFKFHFIKTGKGKVNNGVVIFSSSGSTGVPKLIVHDAKSLITFVKWTSKKFLNRNDHVLSVAPFFFDLSLFDIFSTLNSGATICLPGPDEIFSLTPLPVLIRKYKITTVYAIPNQIRGILRSKNIRSIRTVISTGEKLEKAIAEKILLLFPNIKLYNFYGPTETNVITWHQVLQDDLRSYSIPIGMPCPYAKVKICKGEIVVKSKTNMLGYLGKSLLEKEKWYFTGDFGSKNSKGQILIEGRKDSIFKIKGFRVSLEEVESAVKKMPGINYAVAHTYSTESQIRLALKIYYSDKKPNLAAVSEFLWRELPYYMVPTKIFLQQGEPPRLSNGKLARSQINNIV